MSQGYNNFFATAKKVKNSQSGSRPRSTPLSKANGNRTAEPKNRRKSVADPTSAEMALRKALNLKSKSSRSNQPPIGAFVFCVMGLTVSLLAYIYLEDMEQFAAKVKVSWFSSAGAAQGQKEKSSAAKASKGEKSSAAVDSAAAVDNSSVQSSTAEEFNYLGRLAERKQQLDQREAELSELEEELHKQREEIEARIQYLQDVRRQIAGVLKERVEVDEQKVKKLVDVYSNMKPQQAAEILGNLNDELAVEVLGRMKKKNAADILNLLKPEKARTLSERYAGYQQRP